eukprot:7084600-Karenia_brevis.AAC.1
MESMMKAMMAEMKLTVHTAIREETEEIRAEIEEVRDTSSKAMAGVSETKEMVRKLEVEVRRLESGNERIKSDGSAPEDRELQVVAGGFQEMESDK